MVTPERLVLRSSGVPATRRGRWLWVFAIAFFIIWLFAIDALFRDVSLPGEPRSILLRQLLVGVAVVPTVLAYVASVRFRMGHALGLTEPVLTRAVLDPSGVELSFEGSAPVFYRWDDIVALEKADGSWRLVGPDGSTRVTIPSGLAIPRSSWSDAPTLAEAVVQMRPDRFALRGVAWEPGLTEFALREPSDRVGRPR